MDYDDEDRTLKVMQMRADIANRMADTAYKQGLLKFEPWKVMATVMTATAAVFGILGGMLGYMLRGAH